MVWTVKKSKIERWNTFWRSKPRQKDIGAGLTNCPYKSSAKSSSSSSSLHHHHHHFGARNPRMRRTILLLKGSSRVAWLFFILIFFYTNCEIFILYSISIPNINKSDLFKIYFNCSIRELFLYHSKFIKSSSERAIRMFLKPKINEDLQKVLKAFNLQIKTKLFLYP